jgi:hypothetical protein
MARNFAYNNHLKDEMLVVRVVVQEVACDTDNDDRADPGHGVAASDGEAESLGGDDVENHFEFGVWLVGCFDR